MDETHLSSIPDGEIIGIRFGLASHKEIVSEIFILALCYSHLLFSKDE